jgi:hypothetical protein
MQTFMPGGAEERGRVSRNSLIQDQAHDSPVRRRCFPPRCPQG